MSPEDAPSPSPPSAVDSFADLVTRVRARLRNVCRDMADDDFTRMVEDIARMHLRFAEIDARYGALGDFVDQNAERRFAKRAVRGTQERAE